MNEKTENAQPEAPQSLQITIQDLMVMRGVIDAATKGGVLGSGDLSTVGLVHDKIHTVIEEFMAKQKAAEDAAKAEPVEGEVKE